MNKIVVNFGLLVFFVAIIFFTQQGLSIEDVLLKSFIIFFSVTITLGLLTIAFIKAINKASEERAKKLNQNIIGNQDDE